MTSYHQVKLQCQLIISPLSGASGSINISIPTFGTAGYFSLNFLWEYRVRVSVTRTVGTQESHPAPCSCVKLSSFIWDVFDQLNPLLLVIHANWSLGFEARKKLSPSNHHHCKPVELLQPQWGFPWSVGFSQTRDLTFWVQTPGGFSVGKGSPIQEKYLTNHS